MSFQIKNVLAFFTLLLPIVGICYFVYIMTDLYKDSYSLELQVDSNCYYPKVNNSYLHKDSIKIYLVTKKYATYFKSEDSAVAILKLYKLQQLKSNNVKIIPVNLKD